MQNKSYTDPLQLTLPIEFAPSVVRAHGLTVAHPRPLVSYGKDYGRVFCFRTSPRKAWRYAEVEYANAGSSYGALALDCDDADAYARGFLDSEIPPPNWRVFRPDTGHSHAVWTLAVPVHKHPKARRGPLDYFAAIAEFYALTLGADPGYNGVLVHNPVSTPYETRWGPELPYPLEQLARVIPFGWRAPDVRQTGVGRNCDLFRAGMVWAGREANARLDVLPALLIVNQRFAHPLPLSEVRATARSIEKYRDQWTARGWHAPRWLARQAARGHRGGIQSGAARRVGSPLEHDPKPWETEGISRRTWFYRQAQARMALKANTEKRDDAGLARVK